MKVLYRTPCGSDETTWFQTNNNKNKTPLPQRKPPAEQASCRIEEVLYEPHFREGANTQKQRMQKLSIKKTVN